MANDPGLLRPFQTGEMVEVRRVLDGKTVSYMVEVREASSLGPIGMRLSAMPKVWGSVSHVDGRIERQAGAIDRLLAHLRLHCDLAAECEAWGAYVAQHNELATPQV